MRGQTTGQPVTNPVQPVAQQGVLPGMQTGMQPGMQTGMQPGMQTGIQPGVQPGMQPMQPYPTVNGGPYGNVGSPNYSPYAQWPNSQMPGLANPYQQSQPSLGYPVYSPYSPAEAAGKLYTNAQYEALLENPSTRPQLQNIINALYRKQYQGLGMNSGKGPTVIQFPETNPIKKKFNAIMNLFSTFTKGTLAPFTSDIPVVGDAVNIGTNLMDSGLNLIQTAGSSALNPGTTTTTRINGNTVLVN